MKAIAAKALPFGVKLGWAIGEFAIACHMAIVSIFLLFYLTDVQHIPAALAGTLLLVPRIWNIITDPLMGAISDRVKTRWGRRRPFLLAGSVLWGASFAALFWIPGDWSVAAKSAWFGIAYFLVNSSLSLYHVPYSAMAAEMTMDSRERLSLVGYKEIAARLSVLLAVMVSPLLVSAAPDAVTGHRWVGILAGTLISLSGLVAFFSTAKAPSTNIERHTVDWRTQLRTLLSNKPLAYLSGAFLFSSAIDAFYSAMLIYLLTIVLQQDGAVMGVLYPIGSLTAIVMTPVWSKIAQRIGKRAAYSVAFACASVAFALSFLLSPGHFWPLIPFMMLVGASMAGLFLLPGAMVPDTVDHDAEISGLRREGTIYGAWICVQQTGMALGAFLVGVYLDLIGHQSAPRASAATTEPTLIKFGFAFGPLLLAIAAILLLRKYTLASRSGDEESTVSGVLPVLYKE